MNRRVVRSTSIWIAAIVAVGGSTWMSFYGVLEDHCWLARSGALVVMLGIWSGLGGIIEESLLRRSFEARTRMAERRIRRKYRNNTKCQEELLEDARESLEQKLEQLQAELQLKVGLEEATLLIAGTLIWGFGDLIKYLV